MSRILAKGGIVNLRGAAGGKPAVEVAKPVPVHEVVTGLEREVVLARSYSHPA